MKRRTTFLLWIVLLLLPAMAHAGMGSVQLKANCSPTPAQGNVLMPCTNEKIFERWPVTYGDALRSVNPAIKPEEAEGTLGETTFLTLDSPARLLLLDRGTGTLNYLLLEPSLKPLSSANSAQDMESTLLTEIAPVPVSPGQFVFAVNSAHSNSSFHYDTYSLFLASADRVGLIYEGPGLISFSSPPPSECYTQQDFKSLTALPAKTSGFSDLKMTVTEQKTCPKGGKDVVVKKQRFEAILKWDGKKYMGGSKPLYLLNKCRDEGKPNCL